MQSELKNQTLVAAALAKQNGFENTYQALIDMIKETDRPMGAVTSTAQDVEKI